MNLVVGATGIVGSEICRGLAAAGQPVRALVREASDPDKVARLEAQGVTLVRGDLRDRASLDAACDGVTAVMSTASAMPFSYQPGDNDLTSVDQDGLSNLIDAAKAADIARFIYTSFNTEHDHEYPLQTAKVAVEQRLKDSGLTYAILRPSYFMEVWLTPVVGFDPAGHSARIYGTGEQTISFVSFLDVARFAIASVDHPAAENATIHIGGPQAISPLDVVQIFERVSGSSFTVEHVPADALLAQQSSSTDPMEQSFAGLMHGYALGHAIDMSTTAETFAIELKSVEQYAQEVCAAA